MAFDASFSPAPWLDYMYWQTQDAKTLKKINALIKELQRTGGDTGTGKPELLRGAKRRSRRIDSRNKLQYEFDGTRVYIFSCRDHYHYDD